MTKTGTSPSRSSEPARGLRTVVVGPPESRRVSLFRDACARLGADAPAVVGYADLLDGRADLRSVVEAGAVVRIESPGKDFEVERRLVALGSTRPEAGEPPIRAEDLAFDRGRILRPRLWALGLTAALELVASQLADCPPHTRMNDVEETAIMFDKRLCHERLRAGGVPVPLALGPVGSYAELLERMREARRPRVFVKLAFGSSASGVIAYERAGAREQAWTTVELVREGGGEIRLYNTRALRRYRERREIETIVDALCREGVHVEEWVPKADFAGGSFDLRVVAIGGRAAHAVPRVSRTPMTNLHLLNARGSLEALVARIGPDAWRAVEATCERAAACFPRSLHVGLDVGLTPGFRRRVVFEANAFGDLLPGVLHDGRDTYEAELLAAIQIAARREAVCAT